MKIREYTANELIEKLKNGELSVLDSLGAEDLRLEMAPVGKACSLLANILCSTSDNERLRKRSIALLRFIFPAKLDSPFPGSDDAVVIGFNHPSLGEIFRLLYLGFEAYPGREFLFPVNIPWYESIAHIIPKLRRLNINITPMITPSTEKKLRDRFAGDEEKLKDVQHLKTLFERRYMRVARAAAESGGVILVAPSATRQATVFSDHLHPTMTILAHMIYRKNETRALFVPVTILEPKNNDRKINAFKLYGIYPRETFSTEEVKLLAEDRRNFDYEFLKRIDGKYRELK